MSESSEMYLATIIQQREAEDIPVPLSQLAEALEISSVSANEMCRKLQDQELVIYKPYKGVTLTPTGEKRGRLVLRRRGLWMVFLTEKLEMDPYAAEEVADQLEHTTPNEVADRLDHFLGYPRVAPLGMIIPPSAGACSRPVKVTLAELSAGQMGFVVNIYGDTVTQGFLKAQGLKHGVLVKVLAVTSDNQHLITIGEKQQLALSPELSQALELLKPGPETTELAPKSEDMIAPNRIPLTHLKQGQTGIIVQVKNTGAIKQRLLDMGVVPGTEICLKRRAPFGDPLEFTVKGYQLSLRKCEAQEILVELPNA